MRLLRFGIGIVLFVWLCRHYSFWVVFGGAYAVACGILVVVCFAHDIRRRHNEHNEKEVESAAPMLAPDMDFEVNK